MNGYQQKPTGLHVTQQALADTRGGARDARPPPWGSKFFHFHAVFGKNVKNNSNFGSWCPPLGKILDPPLASVEKTVKQECIPVGCITSAAVVMSLPECTGQEECLPRGCLPVGCLAKRGCLTGGGCLPRGRLAKGGVWPRGVCQGGVSHHTLRQTSPVDRMTDWCKNITFANYVCER